MRAQEYIKVWIKPADKVVILAMIFSSLVRNVENLVIPIYRKDAVVCYNSSFMIYYITADQL